MDLTIGKVFAVFLLRYRQLGPLKPRKRLMAAETATMIEVSDYPKHQVVKYLNQILEKAFATLVRESHKYTPREEEGCAAGGLAAIRWFANHPNPISPLKGPEWTREVHAIAFSLMPAERDSDKEWRSGFLTTFTIDTSLRQYGQTPIGEGWGRG